MQACWCILAGTKACDNCPNGPSKMDTSIPRPFGSPGAINIEHLTVNIDGNDDPEEVKRKLKKVFEELQGKTSPKIINKTWTSTSL